mgnify:CR=1 FL=1
MPSRHLARRSRSIPTGPIFKGGLSYCGSAPSSEIWRQPAKPRRPVVPTMRGARINRRSRARRIARSLPRARRGGAAVWRRGSCDSPIFAKRSSSIQATRAPSRKSASCSKPAATTRARSRRMNKSLAVEPNDRVETRRDALIAKAELAKLPEEYRAIESATEVTRGDLAALIGVRLNELVLAMRSREPVVVTDVRGNWPRTGSPPSRVRA